MKINATTRLLAANLPPELLAIDNNSYFRKELAKYIRRFGIDLNTAKFEQVSNEEALRALKGNKGFGVLFCFNTKYRDEPECSVIGLVKTSESRYSTSNIISTYPRIPSSPISIIKNCDLVYFVRGNQADYDRLSKLRDERYSYGASPLYPRDYAKENKDRYTKQLAERRFQAAKANAIEIIKLAQEAIIRYVQHYLPNARHSTIRECLEDFGKEIDSTIEASLGIKWADTSYIKSIAQAKDISDKSLFIKLDLVNELAKTDISKVRNALNRL